MIVRIGPELLNDLQKASKKFKFSYSEIARKAMRKYSRIQPDLSALDPGSTYEGIPVRFDLITPVAPEDLRKILAWYIGLHDLDAPIYDAPAIPPTVARVVAEF